jgi:glucoamylase
MFSSSQSSLQEPFSSSEVTTMRNYFLANINIQGKGGVVAAPDYDTPGGSYYYHWMRDAALTMRCLQETNPGNFSSIESTVKSYIGWVLKVQSESDPNGIDVRTEPKFMLPNGEVFSSAWCRPQNDGPGLRATTLMIAAQHLIDQGELSYVKANLWTGNSNSYHGGAIKYDLDYIVSNWNSNTCDLWEEIRDTDFFWNRITMKKAMILGSKFAAQMGDSASAATYSNMISTLNANLYSSHYNGGFVQESGSRPQDSAVIVGFNDGFDEYDRLFAPSSVEVAKTVASYNTLFCNEYAINTADTQKGISGVLYGRYKGDTYAGGNPWVLSTAALAGLFYRGASYIKANGVPSADALSVWKQVFNTASLPSDAASLAKVFAQQGDGVMLRLRAHVSADGFHLDEQMDRNTGAQMSAEDLTWSYAEVLNAMNWRNQYIKG